MFSEASVVSSSGMEPWRRAGILATGAVFAASGLTTFALWASTVASALPSRHLSMNEPITYLALLMFVVGAYAMLGALAGRWPLLERAGAERPARPRPRTASLHSAASRLHRRDAQELAEVVDNLRMNEAVDNLRRDLDRRRTPTNEG